MLQRLETLPVSAAVKKQLAGMLRATANKDSGQIDIVIGQLDKARQEAIVPTLQNVSAVFDATTARGGQELLAMDESEFQRLVEEANAK